MCDLLGVDAFISVNAGFGDAHSAAQLVEYVNGAATTPMGKLRAANGHPDPYKVKWWGIGNEMYGTWQFGYMAPKQYVVKHNLFAKAMRAVDPTITLLATGATPEEMTVNRLSMALTGKVVPDYGSDADFTGLLLANCLDNIDVMSEHYYSYNGERFDLEQNKRIPIEEPLPEAAYRAANRVRSKVEAYEEYARRFPALQAKHLQIAIDEWAFTRLPANLKQTLANAVVFHEMFRHTDLIRMAGHTMATSSIEFNATDATLNTTGLLFQLYRDHFGTVPVQVDRKLAAAGAEVPGGRRSAEGERGQPHLPAGCERRAFQRWQVSDAGGDQSDRIGAATRFDDQRHRSSRYGSALAHDWRRIGFDDRSRAGRKFRWRRAGWTHCRRRSSYHPSASPCTSWNADSWRTQRIRPAWGYNTASER